MVRYRHTQIGTLMIVALGGSLLFLIALSILTGAGFVALGVGFVLAACLAHFSSLTTTVTDTDLELRFGTPLFVKRVPIREIAASNRARNPWYYGWGIHAIPGGWVYNVSGLDAVELTLRGGGRLRVGTDDPEGVLAALELARRG